MRGILNIMILCVSNLIFGQAQDNDTVIIRNVIKQSYDDCTAYIDTTVGWGVIHDKIIKKRNFKGFADLKHNTLKLSRSEYKHILNQINIYKSYSWEKNLLYNSICIEKDSMWIYLRNESKKIQDIRRNAIKNNDSEKIKELRYKYPWIFGFSKPIFFRDGEYCLFYYFKMCGNPCGLDELAFYKNINNKWEKWIVLRSGDY